jgi:D-sedoheptulose 7-phosphate isomerase
MHNVSVIRRNIEERYRQLLATSEAQIEQIESLASEISNAFKSGKTLYAFGNGGSAAEAQHFTTELIGRFKGNRKSLPAISLCSDSSAMTCIANDFGFDSVFSRQVDGLVEKGDVVFGFTTSGNSKNVLAGLDAARKRGAKTFLITGQNPNITNDFADIVFRIGGNKTAIIQESHLMLIHLLSELIEINMELDQQALENQIPQIVYDYDFKSEFLQNRDSVVWVNGCFDVLHEGHLMLLNTASRAGTFLVVGVNSDSSVKKLKGDSRPVIPEMSRARTLAQLPFVDLVVIFSKEDPLEILSMVRPNVVIKGDNYKIENFKEKSFLLEINCDIRFTHHIEGVSSSTFIRNVKK